MQVIPEPGKLYADVKDRNALHKAVSDYSVRNSGRSHEAFNSQHKAVSELLRRMKNFANLNGLLDIIDSVEKVCGGIIIVSDYDADGICSMTEFCDFLELVGIDYVPFIPDREEDGYGISLKILPKLSELGLGNGHFQTVVCLDNGVNRTDVKSALSDLGIAFLAIDHHMEDVATAGTDDQTDFQLNPHLSQNADIFKDERNINTGALVYGFCLAYMLRKDYKELAKIFADMERDLVFVSIVGDSMPMRGLNKALVSAFRTSFFLGDGVREPLKEIIDEYRDTPFLSCDWDDPTANGAEEFAAWTVVPRLNSLGRIADAMDAVRFLQARGVDRAAVERVNAVRKGLTEYLKGEIYAKLARDSEASGNRTIVHVGTRGSAFKSGVRSVLAGYFSDKLGKVAAFGTDDGTGIIKLSLRSPYPIDFKGIFQDKYEFSGHKEAGVVSVQSYAVAEFIEYFESAVAAIPEGRGRSFVLCELPDHMVSVATDHIVKSLGPWGKGNTEPLFLIKGRAKPFADAKSKKTSGGKQKIRFVTDGGLEFTAYNWGVAIPEDKVASCTGIVGRLRHPFGRRSRIPAVIVESIVVPEFENEE